MNGWRKALIEAWRYLEVYNKASVRKAMVIARMTGEKFTDAQAYDLLSKFRDAAAQRSAAEIKHERSTSPQTRRVFARINKVLLVTKKVKTSSLPEPMAQAEQTLLGLDTLSVPPRVPTEQSDVVPSPDSAAPLPCKKPRKPAKPKSDNEIAAYRLLDALKPHIELVLTRINFEDWRRQNKFAACEIARGGTTPDELVRFWHEIRAKDGSQYTRLDWLHQAIARSEMPKQRVESAPPWQRPDPYAKLAEKALARMNERAA